MAWVGFECRNCEPVCGFFVLFFSGFRLLRAVEQARSSPSKTLFSNLLLIFFMQVGFRPGGRLLGTREFFKRKICIVCYMQVGFRPGGGYSARATEGPAEKARARKTCSCVFFLLRGFSLEFVCKKIKNRFSRESTWTIPTAGQSTTKTARRRSPRGCWGGSSRRAAERSAESLPPQRPRAVSFKGAPTGLVRHDAAAGVGVREVPLSDRPDRPSGLAL